MPAYWSSRYDDGCDGCDDASNVTDAQGFGEAEIMGVIKAVLGVEAIPQALEKHLASKNLQSPLLAKEFAYELMATNAIDIKGVCDFASVVEQLFSFFFPFLFLSFFFLFPFFFFF
jgi:hypothetical protein